MEVTLTPQELSQYNGRDPSKPIYVAIKGRIFDVTTGKSFYGPEGSYSMFAGKDASRALGKMSKSDEDISPSIDDLTEKEMGVLNDWEKKFEAKYPIIGRVVCGGNAAEDILPCSLELQSCKSIYGKTEALDGEEVKSFQHNDVVLSLQSTR
ncbi:hypothetical protein G4B88_019391 [Cannabis sativa]|uniref:Cytochrome b5 heme-binding domain-containing protein n=2 Tax=Cannabis sativa TaxID=3483 RepID=A0A7J6HY18_CANSA|nr:hypothetical protein G4B88_019391 [Cannabis sativa]